LVLCIKTVEEYPMVPFIVVIVETFVHVLHKSNIHWIISDSYITRGLKNFAPWQVLQDFTEADPVGYLPGVFFCGVMQGWCR
jgi:glutaredoxin-related protein